MRNLLLTSILVLALVGVADTQTSWQRVEKTDNLRGTSYSQFTLPGKFLTPPSHGALPYPEIVVNCVSGKGNHGHTSGKFLSGGILVGAVVDSSVDEVGSSFIGVEYRLDDGKLKRVDWRHTRDFSSLLFNTDCPGLVCGSGWEYFAELLYGHELYHKENTNPQIRKVVIGVPEFVGGEVVMQFDLPDVNEVAETCGIVWHK